ncbi:hypothetical protein L1O03_11215 [Corynebacterium uropygiale]|uniref:Uncharacterized protein n=1 Tax=Corynebacterium uropygiale TaxID=1775911 RepID=A0A9X1QTV5_9CORY|nr:hypothetical protein [Corynebacterium uropygiale]MCF4007733.1 hypothetical protein [Corynebacterium uropygiale]
MCTTGILTPPVTNAQDQAPFSGEDPTISQVQQELDCSHGEHKVFLDSQGTKHSIGCQKLEKSDKASTTGANGPFINFNHWSPYEDHTFHCGSSTVRNQQIAYLHYRGTVHASGEQGSGGDCGGQGRVVGASITYKRDGKQIAKAVAGVGETQTAHAWDDINSNAPATEMYFDFTFG